MIIKEHTLRNYVAAWSAFLGVYALIYGVTLFLGRFVDASWDINLLLFLNPDRYVPILDELVIFQTDFGGYYVALLLISWQVGYYLCRNSEAAQQRARVVFYGLAVLFALWHGLGFFIQKRGIFWWSEYEYPVVLLMLAATFAVGMSIAGNLYVWLDDEDQRKLAHAFWLMLLALFFVNIIGEDSIKEYVGRHRPLHGAYEAWNSGIRILPDEVVRGSYSYISGHTSSFWAQILIYFWLFKSWRLRGFLAVLGLFHGFTRIYTAAHFPYCVLMATVFAFTVTSMLYVCLWNHKHLPILAMTFLCGGLYLMTKSPAIPASIFGLSVFWFLANRYWMRNNPDSEECLDPSIDLADLRLS